MPCADGGTITGPLDFAATLPRLERAARRAAGVALTSDPASGFAPWVTPGSVPLRRACGRRFY